MKVLVIGSGGREHALVQALADSPQVDSVLAAPGNPGMVEAQCLGVKADDISGLLQLVETEGVDFTVVGPEAPLVAGIVDTFTAAGHKIFGASRRAAALEGSKAYTKDFLKKYRIPTADYATFTSLTEALKYLQENADREWVVKIDGLAAGKGVFVTRNFQDTQDTLEKLFSEKPFGDQAVVLEEFLDGEELSFMVLCDGERALPLASSQDHKRLGDGDAGPNTGGMGAYSPAPLVTPDLHEKIMNRIVGPTLKGMAEEGSPFKGILYAGVMVVAGEPLVLEFNVRFGDPEAQVILPRLASDWMELFLAAEAGRLDQVQPRWKNDSAVVIVLAAAGYPEAPRKGDVISGLDNVAETAGVKIFHAGTARTNEQFVTAGGRVLGVTALGPDLKQAVQAAYGAVDKIQFSGMQFRSDIAQRGLNRLKTLANKS